MSNRIVHFEIPFTDGDRARTFYREAFGWDVDVMPDMAYTMVRTGPVGEDFMPSEPGFINGGMFERTEPFSGPVVVIDVASIDDTVATLTGLGGAVVGPKEKVGDMGYAAYFRDPEGNIVGLWENAWPQSD